MDPIIQELMRRYREGDPIAQQQLLELVEAGNEEARIALTYATTLASDSLRGSPWPDQDTMRTEVLQANPLEGLMKLASMLYGGGDPASATPAPAGPARPSMAAMQSRAEVANPAFIAGLAPRAGLPADAGPTVPTRPGNFDIVQYLMSDLMGAMQDAQADRRVEAYQFSEHGRLPAGEGSYSRIRELQDMINYNRELIDAGFLPKMGTRPAGSAIRRFIQAHGSNRKEQ